MITKKELSDIRLSATKKDYYQIWNELLETAKKLSDRWDPTSTNESDPGIVLLKCLTAIADKLNYNIDKNILEAFLPTAAQIESMRKLCGVLGYNMKYYQSAETEVTIAFKNTSLVSDHWPNNDSTTVTLPRFTTFSDVNNEIHFVTTEPLILSKTNSRSVNCIEGQIMQCTSENDNIISINQLDDNNRYYLPETQIAENGIFIYNYTSNHISGSNNWWSDRWIKVDNLNGKQLGNHFYSFGYDSTIGYPYIEFPADIAQIIENGLAIYYIRTSGASGNISARTLATFTKPSTDEWTGTDAKLEVNDFTVTNLNATSNGANLETINAAFNNFKKTIGTFDTLVTCRDYMNKIYQLLDENNDPLVSNCIVSDVSNDINRSKLICTFESSGISYMEAGSVITDDNTNKFAIILYPFQTVKTYSDGKDYLNSFRFSNSNVSKIEEQLKNIKTVSHELKTPDQLGDATHLAIIKVYLKLNVRITTNYKVNLVEQQEILNNIKIALYKNFNSRQIDFGEEIPTESIETVIENADSRINHIDMTDPDMYTRFMTFENSESDAEISGQAYYNQMVRKNVLAGNVEMFNYDTRFSYNFGETAIADENPIYEGITKLEPTLTKTVTSGSTGVLTANEVISFRAKNINTILTYPAFINYYAELGNDITGNTITINANEDYELKAGQYIYINYTEASSTDPDNQKKSIKNIYYGPGTIIRPNFELQDSASIEPKTKKITGNFIEYTSEGKPANPGESKTLPGNKMLTLGTNEQIELRKVAVTTLEATSAQSPLKVYTYWTSPKEQENLEWKTVDTHTISYILEDGEYFYYTDANKLDMAWYGSGTEITITNISKNSFIIPNDDNRVSAESILEEGLEAIPWLSITLENISENIKKIEFTEYQYLNYVKDDKIENLGNQITGYDPDTGDPITNPITEITSTWIELEKPEKVKINGSETLPIISVKSVKWEVRSRLEINIGPNTIQKLSTGQTVKATYENTSKTFGENKLLKANYNIQSSSDLISTTVKKYDINTGQTVDVNNFAIKQFEAGVFDAHVYEKPQTVEHLDSYYHNFGDKWTRFNFSEILNSGSNTVNDQSYIEISLNIPADKYGLIMFYLPDNAIKNSQQDPTCNPYITYTAYTNDNDDKLEIFNYKNGGDLISDKWWDGLITNTDHYHLRKGINVVKFTKAGILKIYPDATTSGASVDNGTLLVILSDLDVVNENTISSSSSNSESDPDISDLGINNELLCYKKINDSNITEYEQLLYDIAKDDTNFNFYYNCPIENSYALDVENHTMEDPEILFDKNNVANNFVICELDISNLNSDITIARSSKL